MEASNILTNSNRTTRAFWQGYVFGFEIKNSSDMQQVSFIG